MLGMILDDPTKTPDVVKEVLPFIVWFTAKNQFENISWVDDLKLAPKPTADEGIKQVGERTLAS